MSPMTFALLAPYQDNLSFFKWLHISWVLSPQKHNICYVLSCSQGNLLILLTFFVSVAGQILTNLMWLLYHLHFYDDYEGNSVLAQLTQPLYSTELWLVLLAWFKLFIWMPL